MSFDTYYFGTKGVDDKMIYMCNYEYGHLLFLHLGASANRTLFLRTPLLGDKMN
jgi:hypothetical protein